MTTNGSAAVAVEAATAERILHKLRDKGRRERSGVRRKWNEGKAVVVASLSWLETYLPGEKVKSHFEEANSVRFDEG